MDSSGSEWHWVAYQLTVSEASLLSKQHLRNHAELLAA